MNSIVMLGSRYLYLMSHLAVPRPFSAGLAGGKLKVQRECSHGAHQPKLAEKQDWSQGRHVQSFLPTFSPCQGRGTGTKKIASKDSETAASTPQICGEPKDPRGSYTLLCSAKGGLWD